MEKIENDEIEKFMYHLSVTQDDENCKLWDIVLTYHQIHQTTYSILFMAILRRVFRDIAPERGPVQFKNLATMNFPTTMQST